MKRRDFLRLSVGSGLALWSGAIERALAYGIWAGSVSSSDTGARGLWANWNEADESKLANADVLSMVVANINADGNETAQGLGLSGTDLVFTCANMDGMSGGTRQTVVTSTFTITETFLDTLFSGDDQFTIIYKVNTLENPGGTANGLNDLVDNDTSESPEIAQDAVTAKLSGFWQGGGQQTMTAAPNTTGDVYIAAWKAKGNNAYMGYKNGTPKPIRTTDFTEIISLNDNTMPNIAANWVTKLILGSGTFETSLCKLYYIVASKVMLFG